MLVAGAVVAEGPLLLGARHEGGVDGGDLGSGREIDERLEAAEGAAGVAVGLLREGEEDVLFGGNALVSEPTLAVLQGAREEVFERFVGERFEAEEAAPGEERGDDGEARVLRRRADEGERPRFDVGEERVLLPLVKAMNFIQKQDRPLPLVVAALLGELDDLAELGDRPEHGAHRHEMRLRVLGDELGEARFADAGRPPEEQRRDAVGGEGPLEEAPLGDEVGLPEELAKRPRAHPLGEGDGGRILGGRPRKQRGHRRSR